MEVEYVICIPFEDHDGYSYRPGMNWRTLPCGSDVKMVRSYLKNLEFLSSEISRGHKPITVDMIDTNKLYVRSTAVETYPYIQFIHDNTK